MISQTPTVTQLYERIPLAAMQQVADSYMAWYAENISRQLDEKIAGLRAELEANDKEEARFKPSAAELEAMRRLQSNNVHEIDLLDRLVEKGEEWLVLTMHRLDYFERAGLAPHDYPSWCEHALIGAYDWIDAGRLQASKRMFSLQGGGTGPMRAIRPADLAAMNTGKTEAVAPPRAEPTAPARPAPQPQRSEAPAPKAPVARAQEMSEPTTQPVPTIPQPSLAAQEEVIRAETAPLSSPPPRPEPARPAAPPPQPPQRPSGQVAQPVSDISTRPTPVATPIQEASAPQRSAGFGPGAASTAAAPATVPPQSAPQRFTGTAPQSGTLPTAPLAPVGQRRPDPPPVARPQPPVAPPIAAQPPVAQRPRPASWGDVPEQRPDPRYSLDDVDLEELEEDGEQQGFLRKIFRVFTQE